MLKVIYYCCGHEGCTFTVARQNLLWQPEELALIFGGSLLDRQSLLNCIHLLLGDADLHCVSPAIKTPYNCCGRSLVPPVHCTLQWDFWVLLVSIFTSQKALELLLAMIQDCCLCRTWLTQTYRPFHILKIRGRLRVWHCMMNNLLLYGYNTLLRNTSSAPL